MKAKTTQPYIAYDKANFLTRLYDFICRANRMRKDVYTELDYMSRSLSIMQNKINQMKAEFAPVENPNARCAEYENDIEALRACAWQAGLTKTLFEKLKDNDFRYRFSPISGEPGKPVTKEEIMDHYSE
jgi:hypothetical protein